MRPELTVEKFRNKKITQDEMTAFLQGSRFPHCDSLILHLPEECNYCRDAVILQEERQRLGVSNTGHHNRAWPCPAEKIRTVNAMHAWYGNQPEQK